ncbi:hypothetical protein AVEN_242712-1 [Araneus ventricosus]|uniref:Uncharacterized protein n=1 Tax=Araneus ventricosus TaxID=182803 RepID=A0A4Y2E135_ARAVE|nr:hypothetical protein AVEN_242712-1 [Araneus ventricosus]
MTQKIISVKPSNQPKCSYSDFSSDTSNRGKKRALAFLYWSSSSEERRVYGTRSQEKNTAKEEAMNKSIKSFRYDSEKIYTEATSCNLSPFLDNKRLKNVVILFEFFRTNLREYTADRMIF